MSSSTEPPVDPPVDPPADQPETRAARRAERRRVRGSRTTTIPDAAASGSPKAPRTRRLAALGERLRAKAADYRELVRPVLDPARAVLRCVSPLGWFVLIAGLGAWVLGALLGWVELGYAAAALLLLFTLGSLFTIGRTSLEVTTRVEPQRVIAGDSAMAELHVRNVGRGPMLPVPLDLQTGETTTRFNLPALRPGGEHEDLVVLPSSRRGVFTIGPARTLRGDPFGMIRRELVWTEPQEFFVHPRTVFVDKLGSGLLKDLEGISTQDVSMSDLAFHTLREYAPGDDRRHIHWLSSAKRSAALGSDTFMVRQFLDTRRSHIGVLVDSLEGSYLDPEEFEIALSAAASITMRALGDGMDLSEATGPFVVTQPKRHTALDVWSRARFGTEDVEHVAAQLSRAATNISGLILLTGPLAEFRHLRKAASLFSTDVNTIVVRVERGAPIALTRSGGITGVTIGQLSDLPRALSGKVIQG